jgi:hypothetical protein
MKPLFYSEKGELRILENKQCTNCLKAYPPTDKYFYKQKVKTKKQGEHYRLTAWCIPCRKEKSNERNQRIKGHYSNYQREYTKNNVKTKNETARKWRIENADHKREYQLEYYGREDRKENFREYSKKRSIKNHKITLKQWDACRLYFDYRCAYCGKTWEQNKIETKRDLHKEHVDDDGSNKLDNCIPSCASCNSQKWEFDFEEWYNEDNPKYLHDRKVKILLWLQRDHFQYL